MNQQTKLYMNFIVWWVLILLAVRCYIAWSCGALTWNLYALWSYAGESITFATFTAPIYKRWIWKVLPHGNIPVFRSRYTGTVTSVYDNQQRTAELYIKQTLLSVSVQMKTDESSSSTCVASFDDNMTELYYTYFNRPLAVYESRSPKHYGTAVLRPSDKRCKKLDGTYFTDRATRGDLHFHAIRRH